MNSYKELIVWQKSILLAKEIYRITDNFPKSEIYGLTNQLRRASAFGSTSEIEAQLILACELSFVKKEDVEYASSLLIEIRKMLNKVLSGLKSKF